MNDDLTLLREFAAARSEAAFAALVTRHVNLVYSVALRQVGKCRDKTAKRILALPHLQTKEPLSPGRRHDDG